MNSFALQTFNGITFAALLFLLASGFTLTFDRWWFGGCDIGLLERPLFDSTYR